MQSRTKAAVLSAIKQAQQQRYQEQDAYRAIIKAAWDTPATEEHDQRLIDLGWEGIEKHMAGEKWPPTSQDWKEYAGLDWSEIPKRKIIDQIEDTDIRHATYFYSEIAEHTERIKAMATFYTLSKGSSDFITMLFWIWQGKPCHHTMTATNLLKCLDQA